MDEKSTPNFSQSCPVGDVLSVVLLSMKTPTNFSTASTATTELLTKKELAKRLRVSERKIELDTDLPCIRWGRTVRFDWQEVVAFLREQNG